MAATLSVIAVAGAGEPVMLRGRAMGTTWSANYLAPVGASLDREALERRIAARLEALEQQFSTYRTNSVLARFNGSASTEWQPVPAELARVAIDSRRVSELTAGGFDATVAPLVELWGFGGSGRGGVLPTETALAAARQRVGWRLLEVRLAPPALRKIRSEVAADFSSMVKGFAADAVAEVFERAGAPNHFVQIGGDIRTGGVAADGRPWRAGVEEPIDRVGAIACVLALSGHALSTSGNYRNHITADGRRLGHIIDPRTGAPVANALAAVSVVHASCAQSSAWATALFVLGPVDGWRLAESEGLACLFFVREGDRLTRRTTLAFEKLMR